MLLMYNYVLLKMSTWYSKHVEGSNNIWRINNIQCITLVVLYGQQSDVLVNFTTDSPVSSKVYKDITLLCLMVYFILIFLVFHTTVWKTQELLCCFRCYNVLTGLKIIIIIIIYLSFQRSIRVDIELVNRLQ